METGMGGDKENGDSKEGQTDESPGDDSSTDSSNDAANVYVNPGRTSLRWETSITQKPYRNPGKGKK